MRKRLTTDQRWALEQIAVGRWYDVPRAVVASLDELDLVHAEPELTDAGREALAESEGTA